MPTIRTTVQPPTGLQIQDIDVTAYNRTSNTLAVGDVVVFDMIQSDAATTGIENAGGTGIFENLITPASTHVDVYPCGIVVGLLGGAGANDTKVKVRVQGIVDALVEGTNAGAAGDLCLLANGQRQPNTDVFAGQRPVGLLLEATASGTAASAKVYFDGINGVGIG